MLHIKNTFFIVLGAALYSFGLMYLVVPNHLYEGGATGINLIIYYLFGVKPSVMNIVINIPLFLLGWRLLGRRTLIYSFIGTFGVTFWLSIFEKISFTIPLKGDLMMVSILAGVFMGLGLGLIFKAGGTTGGSDILARIGRKYTHYTIGQIMLGIDFFVLALVGIVAKDLLIILYTLVAVTVTSRVIDFVGDGSYGSKGLMIVSDKAEELAQAIDSQIERGVTFIKAQGFYSKKNMNLVYSVIYKSQLQETKNLIHQIDPHAFITIIDAHEVLGEGFTLDRDKRPIQS